MRANYDVVSYEMEKCIDKPEIQIKCLKNIPYVLKNESEQENFDHLFSNIQIAIDKFSDNDDLIHEVILCFSSLLDNPNIFQQLSETPISAQIIQLLSISSNLSENNELLFKLIAKAIQIPEFVKQFSTPEFVKLIVQISRINGKSKIHAQSVAIIGCYLERKIKHAKMKNFCLVLILFSKNFPKHQNLQEALIHAFVHLMNSKILSKISQVTLSHFSHVAELFPNDFSIFSDLLEIINECNTEYVNQNIIALSLAHQQSLLESSNPQNLDTFSLLIEVFATKFKNNFETKEESNDYLIRFLNLIISGMSLFLTEINKISQILSIIYYIFQHFSEIGENVKYISPFFENLSTILMIHSRQITIIKKVTGILHKLPIDVVALQQITNCGIVPFLLSSLTSFPLKDDNPIVQLLVTTIANFAILSTDISLHLYTQEQLDILKRVLASHKDNVLFVKAILLTLKSIILAAFSFDEYLLLLQESQTGTNSEINRVQVFMVENFDFPIDDIDIVKSAMMVMDVKSMKPSFVAEIMIKYGSDKEIQQLGLLCNIKNIAALTGALILSGESILGQLIPIFEEIENEPLSSELISLLLQYNRADVIDLLLLHIDKKSAKQIANQFELKYPSQILIAQRLYEKELWQPSPSDSSIIITSLYHSLMNEQNLSASLEFCNNLCLGSSIFSFIIQVLEMYPKHSKILSYCANYILLQEPNEDIEEQCYNSSLVGIVAIALKEQLGNSNISLLLLKVLHFLSYFPSLDTDFIDSLSLQIIIKASNLSQDCYKEVIQILSNLTKNSEVTQALFTSNIHPSIKELIFNNFSVESLQLLSSFILLIEIEQKDLDKVSKMLNSKYQMSSKDILCLLQIILISLKKELHLSKKITYKDFVRLLNLYSNEREVVKTCLSIFHFYNGYESDSDMLFTLLELLRTYSKDIEIIIIICLLLSSFWDNQKQIQTLQSNNTAELMISLLQLYPAEPNLAYIAFNSLHKNLNGYSCIHPGLKSIKDEKAISSIGNYILSIVDQKMPINLITPILKTTKHFPQSAEVIQCFSNILLVISGNDQSHEILLKNLKVLSILLIHHINNIFIVRTILEIIRNLSHIIRNIEGMITVPSIVTMSMKVWTNDLSVILTSALIIIDFVRAGKGSICVPAIPILCNSIGNVNSIGKNKAEADNLLIVLFKCIEIISEKNSMIIASNPEYSGIIAEALLNSLKRTDDRKIPAKAILNVALYPSSHDQICNKLPLLFEMIKESNDDELTILLLNITSCVQNSSKITTFGPFINTLIQYLERNIKIAYASANVLNSIGIQRPDVLLKFNSSFKSLLDRTTDPIVKGIVKKILDTIN